MFNYVMEKCRRRQISRGLRDSCSICGYNIGHLIENSVIYTVDKVFKVKDRKEYLKKRD